MQPRQTSVHDLVRLELDLAYGPDPHNEKVAASVVKIVQAAQKDRDEMRDQSDNGYFT